MWLSVLLGASACQVPGEDWVDPMEATSAAAGSPVTTMTVGGTPTTTGPSVTSAGDTTTDTSTSSGDSGGTGGTGGATTSNGGTTSDTDTDSDSDSDSTSDTTSDTTGGTGGSGGSDTSSDTTSTTSNGGTGGVPENSLIENGDFADGETGWELEGDASVDVSSGAYCMTLNNDGTLHLDWPTGFDPASLEGGLSYVFSYVVYYTGEEPTVSVKLGQPVDPYNAFAEGPVEASTSPQKFTQMFDIDANDQAGIRFSIDAGAGTEVCVDNVALVSQ